MSVKYKTSGSQFYGLVRQEGPAFAPVDKYRQDGGSLQAYGNPTAPMGAGGTLHSGHGSFKTFIEPKHQWNPKKPSSEMAKCKTPSILFKPKVVDNSNFRLGGRFGAMARYGQQRQQEMIKESQNVAEPVSEEVVQDDQSGKIGSAPADLEPGTRIEEGKSVGDVLSNAAGIASTVSLGANALGIPILGPLSAVAAGGLSAAAGIAKLAEGKPMDAALLGVNAVFQGKQAVSSGTDQFGYSGDYGTEYGTASSGPRFGKGSNFSSTFSGYQPGKTLAVDNLWFEEKGVKDDMDKVEQWLKNSNVSVGSDYGSLEEFRGELDEITRVAQAAENEEMLARLGRIRSAASVGVQTSNETQTSTGAQTSSIVANAGTGMEPTYTMDRGTQARNIPEIVGALENQIDILVDQVGQSEQRRMEAAGETVRWLNYLGLDTMAIENAMNRGEIDQTVDLVQQAVEGLEDSIRRPPAVEVRDIGVGPGGVFKPPNEDLITQARNNSKKSARKGGVSKKSGARTRPIDITTAPRAVGVQTGESFVNAPGNLDDASMSGRRSYSRSGGNNVNTQTPSKAIWYRRNPSRK